MYEKNTSWRKADALNCVKLGIMYDKLITIIVVNLKLICKIYFFEKISLIYVETNLKLF